MKNHNRFILLIAALCTLIWIESTLPQAEAAGGRSSELTDGKQKKKPQIDCGPLEEKFRTHLLDQAEEYKGKNKKSFRCLRIRASIKNKVCGDIKRAHLADLKKYRETMRKFNIAMAEDWLKEKSLMFDVKNICFKTSGGKVKMTRNARVLEPKPGAPQMCRPYSTSWGMELSELSVEYFQGRKSLLGFSKDDIKFIDDYQASPLGKSLHSAVRYDGLVSLKSQRIALKEGFKQIAKKITPFQKKISDLKHTELHKLYSFKSQFQKFQDSLPEAETDLAKYCNRSNTAVKTCLNSNKKCGSKFLSFLAENGPIYAAYDAYKQNQLVDGARASNIMTRQAASERKGELAGQAAVALFPVGAIAGAVGARVIGTTAGKVSGRLGPRSAYGGRRTPRTTSQSPKNLPKDGPEYQEMLERAGKFTEDERIAEAAGHFGRTLSRREAQGIRDAHKVGLSRRGSGYGRYDQDEVDEKFRLLEEAGFSLKEQKLLMDRGITGRSPDPFRSEIGFNGGGSGSGNNYGKLTQEYMAEYPNHRSSNGNSPAALATRVLREKGTKAIEEAQILFRKQAVKFESDNRGASARELRISAGDIDHAVDKIPGKKAAQEFRDKWQQALDEFVRQDKVSNEKLTGTGNQSAQYYTYMKKQYEAAIKRLNEDFRLK